MAQAEIDTSTRSPTGQRSPPQGSVSVWKWIHSDIRKYSAAVQRWDGKNALRQPEGVENEPQKTSCEPQNTKY